MSAKSLDVDAFPASPLFLISHALAPQCYLALQLSGEISRCCISSQCRAHHSTSFSSFVHNAASHISGGCSYDASRIWCTGQSCCARHCCIRTSGYLSSHTRNALRTTAHLLQQLLSTKYSHRSTSRWSFHKNNQCTHCIYTSNLYNSGGYATG